MPHAPSLLRSILGPMAVLVLCGAGWLYAILHETPPPEPPPVIPAAPPTSTPSQNRGEFFAGQIQPILQQHDAKNRDAAKRLVARVTSNFETYKSGIDPFTDELTSWGTRLTVLKNMPLDWWNGKEGRRNAELIRQKFEAHILSEQRLADDLTDAFGEFKNALEANRTRLLADVRAAVSSSQFSDLSLPDYAEFRQDVLQRVLTFAEGRTVDSVYYGMATFLASEVGTVAASHIASRLMVAAAAYGMNAGIIGGATAAGAAAGGGSGSTLGPVGTAVGVVIGIGVGIVIDWILTEHFRERLAADLTTYLDQVRDGMLTGIAETEAGEETIPGIEDCVDDYCRDLARFEEDALRGAIVGDAQ